MALEDDFLDLFQGCSRWSGYMIIQPDAEPDPTTGKIPGRAVADHSPVNAARWLRHLLGKDPVDSLGIVPINPDNNSVRWAAWDLDVYKDINHAEIAAQLDDRGIPAVLCRSKSGGAHIYLFFTEWVPAYLAQDTLRRLRPDLGFSKKTEIYPKQRELKAADGQFGNWLNMPYFGGNKRICISADGDELTAEEFVVYAQSRRITKAQLASLRPKKIPDILPGGPPCLNRSLAQGVVHYRNDTTYDLATYYRKTGIDQDAATEAVLKNVADHFKDWPEGPAEAKQSVKNSYKATKAHYRCSSDALEKFCDKAICQTCQFGVRDPEELAAAEALTITELIHYHGDPDSWSVTTSLGTVRVSTKQLCKVSEMTEAYISQSNGGFPFIKHQDWMKVVNAGMLRKVDNEASRELDPSEQIREVLEAWIFNSATTDLRQWETADSIYLAKTEEKWEAHFRFNSLLRCLNNKGYKNIKDNTVIHTLEGLGARSKVRLPSPGRPTVWAVELASFRDSSLTDEWLKGVLTPRTLQKEGDDTV